MKSLGEIAEWQVRKLIEEGSTAGKPDPFTKNILLKATRHIVPVVENMCPAVILPDGRWHYGPLLQKALGKPLFIVITNKGDGMVAGMNWPDDSDFEYLAEIQRPLLWKMIVDCCRKNSESPAAIAIAMYLMGPDGRKRLKEMRAYDSNLMIAICILAAVKNKRACGAIGPIFLPRPIDIDIAEPLSMA